MRDAIHPTALADRLLAALGPSFLGPVAILRVWSFCLFYVMAELWGSVVISVLFWGFANQITTVEEAKEFYPLFGLGANVALIFSGRTVKYFSNMRQNLAAPIVERKKKEKPKLSMGESMKVLVSSRYVRDLATLVVAYGISINLVEVTWKSKLKAQYPSPNEYSSFMGDFSTATGIATFTMMLLGRVILRKFGVGVAATITPAVLLLTGVGFLLTDIVWWAIDSSHDPVWNDAFACCGLCWGDANIFSKSAKYSLFDPCKEMAYIPLEEDMKVKGKAAIDVVCNPLGKSGGALIQQFMILSFGSLANSTPYLGGILLVIVLAWLGAVRSLDSQFSPLAKQELEREKMKAKAVETTAQVVGSGNGSLQETLASESSANGAAIKQSQEPESTTPEKSESAELHYRSSPTQNRTSYDRFDPTRNRPLVQLVLALWLAAICTTYLCMQQAAAGRLVGSPPSPRPGTQSGPNSPVICCR
ncbi:hypothetical protein GUJ93_ZPchr0002g25694 [Zizania palustris]|uniref:ADP,ATP carrier protein n=1 Tax=Zizania palustris TaxID=103762 RepID=A0A8J5RUR4_ZIZPA|nr:hypothetical protein GUJ93_ZPchr0002g25694 [Zizania palustris]